MVYASGGNVNISLSQVDRDSHPVYLISDCHYLINEHFKRWLKALNYKSVSGQIILAGATPLLILPGIERKGAKKLASINSACIIILDLKQTRIL